MASRDPQRPNIVFVLTDDQGEWALGASGNEDAITPSLDAMAEDGVRAANFFCVSPVCSPARASLVTGRIPSAHGVHDWINVGHVGPEGIDYLAGQRIVTDDLSEAGYRCALVGKWHLGANDRQRPGFVHWFSHQRGSGPYYDAPVVRDGELTTQPGYLTDVLTDEAVGFVEREAEREEPFFLALHYTAPHGPWTHHPEDVKKLYEGCEFTSCPQEPNHPWTRRRADGRTAGRNGMARLEQLTGYFAAVTAMDAGVGRVRQALEAAGLTGSTLVVFTSDNGFNLGHHGIWGKGNATVPQNMYDSSVKVPTLFSQPGRIPPGRVLDELLSGYDMAATLLEWVGLPKDGYEEGPGTSFAGVLAGAPEEEPRPVVVMDEYGPVRMIRTHEWKLVLRLQEDMDELYDLVDDPGERENLIGRPEHAARVADMTRQLQGWFDAYVEPGRDAWRMPADTVDGTGQNGLLTAPAPGAGRTA